MSNNAEKLLGLKPTDLAVLKEQMSAIDQHMKLLRDSGAIHNFKEQMEALGQVAHNLPARLNFPKLESPNFGFAEQAASLPIKDAETFTAGTKSLYQGQSKISTAKDLGKMLKATRAAARLNQEQLADIAGVGRRFISELENGKQSLEFGKVLSVAAVLGVDLFARPR